MLVLTPARRESQDEVDVESDALLGGATAETATATLVADSAATERRPHRVPGPRVPSATQRTGVPRTRATAVPARAITGREPRPAARRSGGFGEALGALEAPGREPRLPNIGFAAREDLLDPPVDPRLRGVGNVIDDHGTLGACCLESHSGFVFPAPSVTASQGGESSSSRRPRGVYSSSRDQPCQLSVVPTADRGWPRVSHWVPHLGLEHAYRPSATWPRSSPRCLMVRGRTLVVALGRGAAFSLGFSAVALGALAVSAHRCAAHKFASRP